MQQLTDFLKQHPIFNVAVAVGTAAAIYTAPHEISAATGHPITYEDIGKAGSEAVFNQLHPDSQVLGQMKFTQQDFQGKK